MSGLHDRELGDTLQAARRRRTTEKLVATHRKPPVVTGPELVEDMAGGSRADRFNGLCGLCGQPCKTTSRYCHAHTWATGGDEITTEAARSSLDGSSAGGLRKDGTR